MQTNRLTGPKSMFIQSNSRENENDFQDRTISSFSLLRVSEVQAFSRKRKKRKKKLKQWETIFHGITQGIKTNIELQNVPPAPNNRNWNPQEYKITMRISNSNTFSSKSSVIFISCISFGSWSTPAFPFLSLSKEDEALGRSTFALFVPESPP